MKFKLFMGSLFFIASFLFSKSTIHIIGDSHTGSFAVGGLNTNHQAKYYTYLHNEQMIQIPLVIHWIGPKLMHSFGKDGSFVKLNQLNVKNGDVCVFVFGEIDIRCHIGKQRDEKNRNLSEIFETLTNNYITSILKKKTEFNNLICIVYNVIPPTNAVCNPQYPYYGSIEDRISLTKQLNQMLKAECEKYDIPFLDIYDIYSTEEGELNPNYSDKNVHISSQYGELIRDKLLSILFSNSQFNI